MRNLTQKEIDEAPDWATHFKKCDGKIEWFNTSWGENSLNIGLCTQPIPRKQLDIAKHKFDDKTISHAGKYEDYDDGAKYEYIDITFKKPVTEALLSRSDVISMAKAFGFYKEP